MEDIFEYAAKCVKNKSMVARIGHSAKLHSLRSAVSSPGSAASKFGSLVGAGVRATVNAIPIPVLGGLFGALEMKVERVIKKKLHGRQLARANNNGDVVKFTLKELSVEELDRFRWKVSEAITEFNKRAAGHSANLTKKQTAHATCEAFLELALAIEQVNRRVLKLKAACLGIFGAIKITSDWIETVENGSGGGPLNMTSSARAGAPTSGVNKAIADVTSALIGQIEGELSVMNGFGSEVLRDEWTLKFHGKCDKWCCFRDQGKPDNWANCKDNAAWVLRNLADPIVPDSFNNNLGVLWKEE